MLETDQYPDEPMEPIVAYSPMNMARAVHFTDSQAGQHILTESGTTHVAPNVPKRRRHVERRRSHSLSIDDYEGSETKCCPRRKDGSLAMLSMWRH